MRNNIVYDENTDTFQNLNNGLINYGTRFLERYESGTLCLHLNISIERDVKRLGEFNGGDWCFMVSHPISGLTFEDLPIRENKTAMGISKKSSGNMQHLMLIDVRQFAKNRKRMSGRVLPFRIWLQGIDDCQYIRSNAAENLRQRWITALVLGPPIKNGELRRASYRPTVLRNKFTSEVVKGRPEIIDTISYDRPEARFWLADDVKLKKNQPWFARLCIANDFVRLAVKVASDFTIKSEKVLLCPIELEFNAKRYCHKQSHSRQVKDRSQ